MTVDDILGALRQLARPRPSPFFARRVSAAISSRERRVPVALRLYWFVVVFAAAPLLETRIGLAAAIVAGGVFAFPDLVRAVNAALFRSPRGLS